jgi:hypothetical protein
MENDVISLIFGWLFWQYELVAAMIGHMLFHVVWYPFDLKIAGNLPPRDAFSFLHFLHF